MAGVNNVTGLYNNNNKRISSKLSFDVGQGFTARIVKTDSDSKNVIIKLMDGWQFPAELEKPLDSTPNGLLRFQVEGFKEGKLQIKLINANDDDNDGESSSLEDIIKDQNLSTKDSGLLEHMVKFGIPLTKENISRIKTLIGFNSKMKENADEEEAFIQKYMKSKNIEPGSEKAEQIKSTLKGFFSKLKNMSEEEILTLLENNIDLTEENIDSFNKVFKGNRSIYKALVKGMGKETSQTDEFIQEFMKSKNIEPGSEKSEEIRNTIKEFFTKLKGLSKDEIQTVLENDVDLTEAFTQRYIKSKNIEPGSEKAEEIRNTLKDFFSKLKGMSEDEIQTILENNVELTEESIDSFNKVFKENSSVSKAFVKEIPKGSLPTETLQTEEFIQDFMKSENIEPGSENEKEIRSIIKDIFSSLEGLSNDEIQTVLKHDVDLTEAFMQKNIKSENIKPSSEKAEEIRSILKDFFSKLKNLPEDEIRAVLGNNVDLTEENINGFNKIFKETSGVSNGLVKETPKGALKTEAFIQDFVKSENIKSGSEKAEEIRNTIKDLFSKLKDLPEEEIKTLLENNADLSEENINSFNKVIKENSNISKALVKETLKEAVKTEEFIQEFMKNENIKLGSEKAEEIRGTIKNLFSKLKNLSKDEILTVLDNNVNTLEENVDSFNKAIKENTSIDKALVKGMVKEALQNEDNPTAQLIKQQIELKTEQMKTVIEKLLQAKDNGNPEIFSKVLDNLKEHLNDFKIFNTMSNQYYYMDVPLNIREKSYDFKLIVKDDRKSGKKLDSQNIKLAASVDTVNLGLVDAYFKVTRGKMDIEIKCEEPYVKLLNSGKTILENELCNIGYNVQIVVDKKDKGMNIVDCRDFFGENNLNGINVVV